MSDWQEVTLGEICNIEIGGTPSRSEGRYWWKSDDDGIRLPWVSISDMKGKVITDTKESITEIGALNSNCKHVPQGTLLMSFKLTIGRMAFAGRDLYTNEAISAIRPIKDICPEFLYYGLHHWNLTGDSDQAVKGVTLNKQKLQEIPCLLPPLPEQKKIAEILSSVSSLRLAHSQELERVCLLKKAFETYFLHGSSDSAMGGKTEQIGADRVHLEEIASFSQGIQVGVENHFSRKEAGMTRFLRISDYTKDGEPPRYIDSSFAIKGIVSPEDIVMIRYGEAGRVCRGIQGAIANNLFTITPKSGVSKEYLFMYLSSDLVQEQLKAMTTSTAMPAINFKQLGQIEIKLVHIDFQDAICARLRSVNQKLGLLTRKIQHLERLTQAISNDLLSGRKRVSI